MPFLLLPFNEFFNIKLFTLSCLAFSVYQMIKYMELINPKVDAVFLALFFTLGSPLFTGRMLFSRGIILFLGFLFLYLRYWKLKREKAVSAICFLSVWCYAGFPLLFLLAFLFSLHSWLKKEAIEWKLIFSTLIGLFLGLILHPSMPNQFTGYYVELFLQAIEPPDLEAIAEWMPPDRKLIFGGIWFILPWLIYKLHLNQIWLREHFVFLSLMLVYLIFSTASLRLFEMFWLFGFLFIFVSSEEHRFTRYISIIVLVFFLFPNIYTKMKSQYRFSDPTAAFDAADWLTRNLPKEEKVFLSWGDFPQFVYRSPDKRFLFGMNPIYAWYNDQKKYEMVRRFFEGSVQNFQYIPSILGYKYIIINRNQNEQLFEYIPKIKNVEILFENNIYRIFVLKDKSK